MGAYKYPRYYVIDAVDLRAFDSRKRDYGVGDYIERLGFIPQVITLLENSVEQIHSHDGVVDNTLMPYIWCAERAMPGGTTWTKRQFYGLIEAAHEAGMQFYMGLLGCPNKFEEYNTKAEWLYAHESEFDLFITLRDGSSARDKAGNINPLRRLNDGRMYEDVFIKDALRYMRDYNLDGFYCGDGWCGLNIPLEYADYHPDMIRQFELYSGIRVQGKTTREQADFIWLNPENKIKWISFYADRWSEFYKRVYTAFHAQGKKFMVIDPWARGPVDALWDFGIDYRKCAPYLDALCLEAREENWGKRGGEWMYVWETGERINLPAIRAQAPDLKLYWAACTCNAPEHWIVTRDCKSAIERESLSLPMTCFMNEKGEWTRALEGLHLIFGTDLTHDDWRFLDRCWDFSYTKPISHVYGPSIVYSDAVANHHFNRAERWELNAAVLPYVTAGLPLHSAVNTSSLASAICDGYIVVDPVGITDREVEQLNEKRIKGAGIIVVGDVDNKKLLSLLGIGKSPALCGDGAEVVCKLNKALLDRICVGYAREESIRFDPNVDALDYTLNGAQPILTAGVIGDERVLISANYAEDQGVALFVRRLHKWPKVPCRGRFFANYKEFVDALPDDTDKFISDVMLWASHVPIRVSAGQMYVLGSENGTLHVGLGNMGNVFSEVVTVSCKDNIVFYDDYPMKRHTPGGYILFDSTAHEVRVKVPMDGSVQLKMRIERNGSGEGGKNNGGE